MSRTPDSSECLAVADLLVGYAKRSLPPEQTASVVAHLAHCPHCQERVTQLQELVGSLAAVKSIPPPPALRSNLMAVLAREKALLNKPATDEAKVVRWRPASVLSVDTWWLRVAASLLLLAVGMVLGSHLPPLSPAVGSLPSSADQGTQQRFQALTGNLTSPTLSASKRMLLVNDLAAQAKPSGDPVVQALINTLNFDPNPNVRLAAGQALYRLRDDPRVTEAFVQSLTIQTDPYVQILLIELLVEMREQRAKPELERLARRPDALPVVRQEAKKGLGLLI